MKVCTKCNTHNADDGVFCNKCGRSLADIPSVSGVSAQTAQAQSASNPGTLWLWLNIAMTVLSCCCNLLSIVGIVFGGIAVSKYKNGLYAEADSNANISKWIFLISLILSVGGILVTTITGQLGAMQGIIRGFFGGYFPNIPGFN